MNSCEFLVLREEYKLAVDHLERESDRFWNRTNIALVVQAAFLAFFGGIATKNPNMAAVICIPGAAFSLLGLGIITKGCVYVQRWSDVVMEIEVQLKGELGGNFFALHHMNDARKAFERRGRFRFPRTTTQMRLAFSFLILFWVLLGAGSAVYGRSGKALEDEATRIGVNISSR